MKAPPLFHYRWFIIALTIYAANLRAQTTRPDAPAKSIAQLKDEARQRVEIPWNDFPSLGKRAPGDVVYLKFVSGQMIIDSKLPDSAQNQRVTMRGYPGMTVYRNTPAHIGDGKFVVVERYDFTDPAVIDVHEMVLISPTLTQLVQDIELPDRTQSVTLSQSHGDDNKFTLRVQTISESDGSEIVNLKLEAPTLAILRRDHPAEVDQYARPIFRSLFQEAGMFGVDEKLAWLVVSDNWQVPTDIQTKTMQIVDEFNSDSYAKRVAAQGKLSALGEQAALYLMSIDRTQLTGEQTARIDQFLHPYQLADAEQCRVLRADTSFLLDSLITDDNQLRAQVLQHLEKLTGRTITLDMKQSTPGMYAVVEKLRDELLPAPATIPSTQPK